MKPQMIKLVMGELCKIGQNRAILEGKAIVPAGDATAVTAVTGDDSQHNL